MIRNKNSRAIRLLKRLPIALVVLVSAGDLLGQERRPDRGLQHANSYTISDIENVNLTNGNLLLKIPLASLPAGRGTSPGYSVALHYNSKLWNGRQELRSDGSGQNPEDSFYTRELIELGEDGWSLDTGLHQLQMTNRLQFEAEAPCMEYSGAEAYRRNGYQFKLELRMPDGSVREFRPYGSGAAYGDDFADGYFSLDPYGKHHIYSFQTDPLGGPPICDTLIQQVTTAGINYFTIDGSRLRLFLPYQPGVHVSLMRWTLYFPHGQIIEYLPQDDSSIVQRLTDRNGNKVVWKSATLNGMGGFKIENETGHYVFISGTATEYKIIQPGVGGELLETRLNWKSVWVYHNYLATQALNANPTAIQAELFQSLVVLDKITLPQQAGGLEYNFTYHAENTQPAPGNYTVGWGQLASITLPGGATANYSYSVGGNDPWMESHVAIGSTVTGRDLTYLREYDGTTQQVTETTGYVAMPVIGAGGVATPDGGGHSENALWRGPLQGYSYRTRRVGGSTVERIWAENTPPGTGAGPNYALNAYVKTEFTTIPDASGNPVLTATKDFDYDQNGNVLEIREYDWVPFDSIPRTTQGWTSGEVLTIPRPTGLPSGLVLRRQVVNTYYNPTPIATDPSNFGPNHYANPASPRLHNVLKSTEVRDGSGNITSRTEFYYDDPSNKGNPIETRVWDSTKGPVSDPLTTSNSISALSEYDQFGNVIKTTDANQNVTQITYGEVFGPSGNVTGLYPTQTVAAHGTSIARTASADYDFHTGVVTVATDVDNNVSTVTEYDAFGRPKKIRSAANTSLESWTRMEYDDVARRVIIRSDIQTIGDGRKVAIQHFDQLGRVRLSRTLENVATEDPYNETHGIKVETRYQFANPHTFQLTSNPFRAVTATQATNEPTMGWTRSKNWNTGLKLEIETFSGATLPAPWGTNASTTGVVKTDIDTDKTVVTDQAGKVRRSVTDVLGRLVRVDEPDANNNLDSAGIPVQPTSYDYDPLDNLTTVNQGSQERTFAYDSLSRLRTAMNPESGTISYQYDANSNLTSKTDARSITATYVYDALNRVTSRSYSDGTPAVTYAYDSTTITNGKGRLASVSSSVSGYTYSGYDALGRVLGGSQTINGPSGSQTYSMSYGYNLAGQVTSMTYPSGHTVTNTYDNAGRLSSFSGNLGDGGTPRTYANEFQYTPMNGLQQEKFGTATAIYHKQRFNSRGQLWDMRASTVSFATDPANGDRGAIVNYYSSNFVQGGSGADNNGNLLRQENYIPGSIFFQDNFAYDKLNRLTSISEKVNGTGNDTFKQSYTYDPWGNRLIDTDPAKTFGTGINNKQFVVNTANNRLGVPVGQSGTMSYDSAGNLTTDTYSGTAVTRVYDAENKMTSETTYNSVVAGSYSYDGDGRRVKRVVGGVETWQVYGIGGELLAEYAVNAAPSTPQKEYGYRNGELLITATATTGWGPPPSYTGPNPLSTGDQIKLENLTELRSAVNQLRQHAGLATYNFTVDPNPQQNVTSVKADHIRQLRTALEEARTALGLSIGGYAHPTLTENFSLIYAVDFQELRNQILSAWQSGGGVDIRWLVSDQLGTPRIILDQTGSLANVSRHDYLPFGEELFAGTGGRTTAQGYTASDNVRQKFTLKERDNETGLDYSINRYYSNVQGRFTSVDPENAGAYAGNPQTWNGYSYGLNNPMLYSDPDGLKVRVCGTDGQCTDDKTDLTDEQWNKWFGGDKSIKAKGGNIYKNGELIGTYQQISCDSCLYDIHALGRQIVANDPGNRAVGLWGKSVIAGLTLPSSAAGYIAIGVFTVLVPPPGEEGQDAVALGTQADRQAAVREAWRQEAERARTGKPTNTPFTADELRQLRDTGKVSGYEGHHTESVSGNPQSARDASKIKFVKGRAAHLREHGGNWRNRTPLFRRR